MIAPLMVMIVHGCECYYSDDFNFHFDSDEGRLATGFIGGLVRSCVPIFVMASAYLLVPIKTDTFTFFKKRAARILCPFIFFLLLYASLPAAWGLFEWSDVPGQMAHVLLNFHPSGSHLWFIYMLIGLYLLMPMISPWLERDAPDAKRNSIWVYGFSQRPSITGTSSSDVCLANASGILMPSSITSLGSSAT